MSKPGEGLDYPRINPGNDFGDEGDPAPRIPAEQRLKKLPRLAMIELALEAARRVVRYVPADLRETAEEAMKRLNAWTPEVSVVLVEMTQNLARLKCGCPAFNAIVGAACACADHRHDVQKGHRKHDRNRDVTRRNVEFAIHHAAQCLTVKEGEKAADEFEKELWRDR